MLRSYFLELPKNTLKINSSHNLSLSNTDSRYFPSEACLKAKNSSSSSPFRYTFLLVTITFITSPASPATRTLLSTCRSPTAVVGCCNAGLIVSLIFVCASINQMTLEGSAIEKCSC